MVRYRRCDKCLWFRSASGMMVHRQHVTMMSKNTQNCTSQNGNSLPNLVCAVCVIHKKSSLYRYVWSPSICYMQGFYNSIADYALMGTKEKFKDNWDHNLFIFKEVANVAKVITVWLHHLCTYQKLHCNVEHHFSDPSSILDINCKWMVMGASW